MITCASFVYLRVINPLARPSSDEYSAPGSKYWKPYQTPSVCPRDNGDEGVHLPRGISGFAFNGRTWRCQCLSRLEGRHHPCSNVSGSCDCDGRVESMEGLIVGREHRPYRRID